MTIPHVNQSGNPKFTIVRMDVQEERTPDGNYKVEFTYADGLVAWLDFTPEALQHLLKQLDAYLA